MAVSCPDSSTQLARLSIVLLVVYPAGLARAGARPVPFTEEAVSRGVDYTTRMSFGLESFGYGVAFADLDKDGDPDLVACGSVTDAIGLWENDGSGRFTSRVAGSGLPLLTKASAVIALDYDADGDLDLYFTRIDVANPPDYAAFQAAFGQ